MQRMILCKATDDTLEKRMRRICTIALCLAAMTAEADTTDTTRHHHWGAELSAMPGRAIVMDQWQRTWQKGKSNMAFDLKITHASLPCDSDDYARDYGWPTLSAGVKWSLSHGVTMHKGEEFWGREQNALKEVDYDSRLGNALSFYGQFARPLLRTRRWEMDYALNFGVAWSQHKYDRENNIDNELVGSRWSIFFGAGLHATWHFSRDWGARLGIDYYHHSNGALNRPNKGANIVGPSLGLVYQPYYEASLPDGRVEARRFQPYAYLNIYGGIGGRTLMEEWQQTQFYTDPGEEDYRTDSFRCYLAYSFGADVMYRYARRWASGIGLDVCYATYDGRLREICAQRNDPSEVSPWSVGIAAKHEAFFGPLSLNVALGFYVFRHMGQWSRDLEAPCYERVGVNYRFRRMGDVKIGINVKAHLTKADLTEVVISYPTTFFTNKNRKKLK